MQGPEKNSYKEFDNEKKFLLLENSPPPPNYFSNGPSLTDNGWTVCHKRERNGIIASLAGARTGKFELLSRKLINQGRADKGWAVNLHSMSDAE